LHLVYRPQDDPLIHDENSQQRELHLVPGADRRSSSIHHNTGFCIADLESEIDTGSLRDNEGEAASYGIFYDDTSYDYMQHLREVEEEASGQDRTVPALEGALRMNSLEERPQRHSSEIPSIPDDGLSGYSYQSGRRATYQNMQNTPDEIAGFQPDMDPRLREALEALEDDAYVDDQAEEDVFGALIQGGKGSELELVEFEETYDDHEDDGWESDATEKALDQNRQSEGPILQQDGVPTDLHSISSTEAAAAASAEDGDWLRDFAKDKRSAVVRRPTKQYEQGSIVPSSDIQAPVPSLYTFGGTSLRQKRRRGALTNPSTYSMTSSSLARTDGQRLLDDRFAKVEESYATSNADEFCDGVDGECGVSVASGLSRHTTASVVSTRSFADGPVRSDFDGMVDEFLDGWDKNHPGGGKGKAAHSRRGKDGNEKISLKMLDEVRQGLGPARLKVQKA
jgi:protein LTV1